MIHGPGPRCPELDVGQAELARQNQPCTHTRKVQTP